MNENNLPEIFDENPGSAAAVAPDVIDERQQTAVNTQTQQIPKASLEGTRELAPDEFLDALDEVLEKRQQKYYKSTRKRPQTASEKVTTEIARKGVGMISLGLILVLFGVIMIYCLFSDSPDFILPLRMAPIAAVILGVEIVVTFIAARARFRINVPSIIIAAALTVGCCVMGVTLNKNYTADKVEYNNRTIASQIYDRSYKELRHLTGIKSIEVSVDLNPDGTGVTKGIDALSDGDYVNVTVEFSGTYTGARSFAADCKKIVDEYRIMGIEVTNFYFRNESPYNTFFLNIEGKFVQDYTSEKLSAMVNYISIEDSDYLEDLKDFEEEETER